jgi:bifunctional DNA-binding transcriptional regulator/antitoxin component of YhaV-PrlF toxin-antitoxin module
VAKVTSKLQVTVPKALAARYRLEPGAEVEWEAGGDAIRLVPAGRRRGDPASRLKLFDQATARQRSREAGTKRAAGPGRGWTREELYDRGRAR